MKRTTEVLLVALVAILTWSLVAVASPGRFGVEVAAAQVGGGGGGGGGGDSDDDDEDDDDDDSDDDDDPTPPPAIAPPPPPPPPATASPSLAQALPVSPAAPLRPFPLVRIRGRTTRSGARLSLLAISAPAGARVEVRCGGRGCPRRRAGRVSTGARLRVRAFERHFRVGTVLRVSVTRPGTIGKYTRIRIRRRAAPVRIDRCLVPGVRGPRICS